MTAENPADAVIEAAATEIHIVICEDSLEECLSEWAGPCLKSARALHDAGVLADPADRDEHGYKGTDADGSLVGKLLARAERAEAERDQLRRWKAEAIPVMLGLQDLGKALGIPLGTRITGEAAAEQARALKAERDHAQEVAELAEKDRRTYHRDALRAEAEVAELRAMRDRVRALADKIARWPTTRTSHGVVAEAITKALDGAGEQP